MPPKPQTASRPKVPRAKALNPNDFQQLYEEPINLTPAQRIQEREHTAKKRRKILDGAYTMHVGPKFRDAHVTRYRATNSTVIESESREGGSLFDYIVDDISTDTIRAYDDCDIMLTDYIHPESPKMISMLVKDMNPEGEVDSTIARIPVPLYVCLTPSQICDVAIQYGLDVQPSQFETSDIASLPLCLIPCNRGSGYRKHQVGKVRPCKVEAFINEVIGRMDRMITNNSGAWDKKEKYFQPIEFKFRVAPRNSVVVKSLRGLQRGQDKFVNAKDPLSSRGDPEMTQADRERYVDEEDAAKMYRGQESQFEQESAPRSSRDAALDAIGEDGTSHAAMLEWKFQMTTHVLMSPQLQSALHQVATMIGKPLKTHGDIEGFLSNQSHRSHLTTLLEYEMLQGETSLRIYTDPRAQDAATKRRMYSAFCLRNIN